MLRPKAARSDAFHAIYVIQKMGYISIPHGLLPVNLIVDPPGAARLVQLLANYAEKAKTASPQ